MGNRNQIQDNELRRLVAVLTTNRLIQREVINAELDALHQFACNEGLNLSEIVVRTRLLKEAMSAPIPALGPTAQNGGERVPHALSMTSECEEGFCPTPDGLCEPC